MKRILALALLLPSAVLAQAAPDAPAPDTAAKAPDASTQAPDTPAQDKVQYRKVTVYDFSEDTIEVCSLPRCPDEGCFPFRYRRARLVRVPEDFVDLALSDFPAR